MNSIIAGVFLFLAIVGVLIVAVSKFLQTTDEWNNEPESDEFTQQFDSGKTRPLNSFVQQEPEMGALFPKTIQIIRETESVSKDSDDYGPLIKDMPIGASGWTVPWCMEISDKGRCYISGTFSYDREQGGTGQMLVYRTVNGYGVIIPKDYDRFPTTKHYSHLIPLFAVIVGNHKYMS